MYNHIVVKQPLWNVPRSTVLDFVTILWILLSKSEHGLLCWRSMAWHCTIVTCDNLMSNEKSIDKEYFIFHSFTKWYSCVWLITKLIFVFNYFLLWNYENKLVKTKQCSSITNKKQRLLSYIQCFRYWCFILHTCI